MVRYYLSQLSSPGPAGAGAEPALAAVLRTLGAPCNWTAVDARADVTMLAGCVVVAIDVIDADHATLVADPRITALAFVDAAAAPLDVTAAAVGDVAPASRASYQAALDAEHIPSADLALEAPLRGVVERIARRCLVRQALGALDLTEGLDTTVGAIATDRLAAITERLTALGFDVGGFTAAATVREALVSILTQDIPFARAEWGAATS